MTHLKITLTQLKITLLSAAFIVSCMSCIYIILNMRSELKCLVVTEYHESCLHTCRSEMEVLQEQLAKQHTRILTLQQQHADEEIMCQERLAEQQLRVKQV